MDDFRVFWATIMIFGGFRSFQNFEPKILKKIQVTFTASTDQTMHFFRDISIFLSQPTCGKLRKIQKSPPKRIVWSFEAVKVKISEIDIFGNIR